MLHPDIRETLKRMKEEEACPAVPGLSDREMLALEWLGRTLTKLSENPKSCNRINAALAQMAIEKLIVHADSMHEIAHKLEATCLVQSEKLREVEFVDMAAKAYSGGEGSN